MVLTKRKRERGREGGVYLDGIVREPDEVEHHLDQDHDHGNVDGKRDAVGEKGGVLLFLFGGGL